MASNVLGRDVVFVPEFCWEKEEFSPKTEGDLGLSIGGNETDTTLPKSNGSVPPPPHMLLLDS